MPEGELAATVRTLRRGALTTHSLFVNDFKYNRFLNNWTMLAPHSTPPPTPAHTSAENNHTELPAMSATFAVASEKTKLCFQKKVTRTHESAFLCFENHVMIDVFEKI